MMNQIIQCSDDEPFSRHFIYTSNSDFTDTDVISKVNSSGKWEGLPVPNNESNINYVQNGCADSNILHSHETVVYSHSSPQQANGEKKQQFLLTQHAKRQHGIKNENRSTRRAKFRSYSKYSIREQSFIGWISDCVLPIWMFAKAGFFYKGFADIVACFECGIIHRGWQQDDDPVKTHMMLQPECPFIMNLLEQGIQSSEHLQGFGSCDEMLRKEQITLHLRIHIRVHQSHHRIQDYSAKFAL
ncbi:baculoviral IAP repeat-containing protein 3-like isoform X2 [Mytilus trossulus]|uniref:baculoviral IAP repeat-containing protein 3-like isoform X2 n=1 Tax=Mytilus trossulus TaxID=6551 RepID=UPI0030056842